ncbi:hypothetical protein K8089_10080 [Aequorivita sp. F47161]|uniref:Uncharacterized protein n=1 Tax=Aequorivita vitellina TaxID=2874475 RepID=A0A9X1QWV4_9FLAO|nr:hypothetical protein [Aequorivita vitellina]MCG2419371.1 hypothetical protein [Aequorivita vitellina]
MIWKEILLVLGTIGTIVGAYFAYKQFDFQKNSKKDANNQNELNIVKNNPKRTIKTAGHYQENLNHTSPPINPIVSIIIASIKTTTSSITKVEILKSLIDNQKYNSIKAEDVSLILDCIQSNRSKTSAVNVLSKFIHRPISEIGMAKILSSINSNIAKRKVISILAKNEPQ